MKFTGRMQGLSDATPRRTRTHRPRARRCNTYDADAGDQITLTRAQQDLLLHVEQNYKQLATLRNEFGGDIDVLAQFRLVDCSSGICHLTGMGQQAAQMLRDRRANPGKYDDDADLQAFVDGLAPELDEDQVREHARRFVEDQDVARGQVSDQNRRRAMQRSAWHLYQVRFGLKGNPPRRANATLHQWSSEIIPGPYDRDYRVDVEWDKVQGLRVVTVSRAKGAAATALWHDEKVTAGYPDVDLAIAAGKERAQHLARKFGRRENPALAILNPLPQHLQRFAADAQLTPAEIEDFNKAIAKYCEFHGVQPEDITITPLSDTEVPQVLATEGANRFLVGMGDTEDVSYSANHKNQYASSNKRGTPFRHEFPSKPHMATDPDGEMIFVINKPDQADHFTVVDWIRG